MVMAWCPSLRLLLLLAAVLVSPGGSELTSLPLGCPLAPRFPLPSGTPLSRLTEHVCDAPLLEWQQEQQLERQLDHEDPVEGRPRLLPKLLELETQHDMFGVSRSGLGDPDTLRYHMSDESSWSSDDGDGGALYLNRWHGLIAPTQDKVPGDLCRNHSRAYVQELLKLRESPLWALRMFDASGKLPDGVLYGNTNLLGSWDGCRSIRASLNASEYPDIKELAFSGEVCSALITPAPTGDSSADERLKLVPPLRVLAKAGVVRYAYCIPSSCDVNDVQKSLESALNGSGLAVTVSDCQAEDEAVSLDAGAWALVGVLALTAAALLVCTTLDVATAYGLRRRPSGPLPVYRGSMAPPPRAGAIVRAFSLYDSIPRLLSTATDERTIGCLHGLRCLTMAWIILGHIYVIGLYLLPVSNLGRLPEFIEPLPFQLLMNAMPSVDTFLVISGMLVALGLAREANAGREVGLLHLPALYLRRFLRLTPLYAAVVWFTASLLPHIGAGAFSSFNFASFGVTGCRDSWWHNLLYINNFFPNDETVCIDQSWYLALDMQLFLLAPLLVLLVLRRPLAGWIVLGVAIIASVIVPGLITYFLDLPPTLLNLNIHATDPEVMEKFTLWVYNAPWSRASPYLVGLALGLVLGGAVKAPSPSRLVSGLLWALSTAIALLVVLGMWNYNSKPEEQWSTGVAVSYAALHRLAWGLCIAWVIWACVTGRGGPVDAFLSHPVWRPLSRLTYAAYLVSIQLMVWYAGLVREPVSCGHLYLIFWFLADLCLTFAVAAVFSLAFEWPTAALERAARERSARTAALAAATAAIFTHTAAERRSSQDSGIHVISVSKRDFTDGDE